MPFKEYLPATADPRIMFLALAMLRHSALVKSLPKSVAVRAPWKTADAIFGPGDEDATLKALRRLRWDEGKVFQSVEGDFDYRVLFDPNDEIRNIRENEEDTFLDGRTRIVTEYEEALFGSDLIAYGAFKMADLELSRRLGKLNTVEKLRTAWRSNTAAVSRPFLVLGSLKHCPVCRMTPIRRSPDVGPVEWRCPTCGVRLKLAW